ncbi:SNF7 family protein [Scenedesmus sp. NREL 46B-D3]|nr:SNF7 family protein [Scenedesmus sp. NREL 46B-D3]
MGNLISGTKKTNRATITDHDRAVLSLKAQRKKMEDQSKLMEQRIAANIAVARQLVAQKKQERALLALKKKRLSEHQLASIQAYLMNVEDMLSNMELTKQQGNVMAALKQGNDALKQAQQEMPLDDIQKLMDETAEAKEYQDKVQDVLSGQLDDIDQKAVQDELRMLEEMAAAEEAAELPSPPSSEEHRTSSRTSSRGGSGSGAGGVAVCAADRG